VEYNKYENIEVFYEGLNFLKIELTDLQKQQFIDYYELLIETNKVMNLTTITDFSEVMIKHFIDSLSLVTVFKSEHCRILDMGTGAGFPGIPLKIAFPDWDIVLLDSLNKRVDFLNEVIVKLKLTNIIAIHGRAEDFGQNLEYRESFDLCVSRAVAKLSLLSEYCIPYVKTGGYFIPYKSGHIIEELDSAKNALEILGAVIENTKELMLPFSDIERTLVVIHKTDETPKKYPRRAGKPSKAPL